MDRHRAQLHGCQLRTTGITWWVLGGVSGGAILHVDPPVRPREGAERGHNPPCSCGGRGAASSHLLCCLLRKLLLHPYRQYLVHG